jgi:hypothetical protein
MSSRLIHLTVVPAGTVNVTGAKVKLSIFTSVGLDGAVWARVFILPGPAKKAAPHKIRIHFCFFNIFSSPV